MPKRSNLFQRVIAVVHSHLNGADATVTESRELVDRHTGELREVDICIERSIPGVGTVVIGVECRDHKRKATVEWVEQIYGKHLHLTDRTVLVSRSGFTGPALIKAEKLRIHTVTPDSNEQFHSDLIERIEAVWAKLLRLRPTALTYRLEIPDGSLTEFRVTEEECSNLPDIYQSDGTLFIPGNDFVGFLMSNIPPDNPAYRDALGEEKKFTVSVAANSITNVHTGEHVDVHLLESNHQFLAKIVNVEVTGSAEVHVGEIPMKHSGFDGVNFSHGSTELAGEKMLYVVTHAPDTPPTRELRVGPDQFS